MSKIRLDHLLLVRRLVESRSQAESYIKLGRVIVEGKKVTKPGQFVHQTAEVAVKSEQYVSRAGLKLASVAVGLDVSFKGAVILDVGSSTGGFTDFALQHGAKKAICIDVGTQQLHPKLRVDSRVELYEQTDIRDVHSLSTPVDIVVIDVSFISLTEILPHVATLVGPKAVIIAMAKPQFEAGSHTKHKGVIKNDTIRRAILKDFEAWLRPRFIIIDKSDSEVTGEKGNRERFYKLRVPSTSK
jgi:23S rRNA (cytidine1920-2'-O)/16S rRNA (cytidine1409-2'-O)-methyltransferase